MARARIWQLSCKSGWNFDRLVADLTLSSQCELTFEMIHMLSYVKKVAPPGTLSVFPSPLQSAESWIRDRWIFRENNSAKSMEHTLPLKKGLRLAHGCLSYFASFFRDLDHVVIFYCSKYRSTF
ncbi:unnamed protein product [Schistosoma margrebowiei]|uniref:Uncharacterized protein n=1 Tax=Schistosoma margrebowiei TaxID=48269 RepID=A0A183MPQ4_9TREM|nr:unnamed protein product [Schistosoma margrebowiei]